MSIAKDAMASDGKNRWIVLLNKSPKGPFVADEIRALLEQQIIRRNDIAYQLPNDTDSKSPTEWKLLWQFPEFNRRRDTPEAMAKPLVASAVEVIPSERRSETPPTLVDIPAELLNIAPEDLIPKSTTISALSSPMDRGEVADMSEVLERPDIESMRAAFSAKWIFGSFGAVLTVVVAWMLYSAGGRTPVAAPRAVAAPTTSESRPAERRAVMTRPSIPPPAPAAPAAAPMRRAPAEAPRRYQEPEVSEPDSGEIDENEGDSAEGDDSPMEPRRMADPRFRAPSMPGMDPADPRMMDPRMMDPRMTDPRMMDPRFRGGRRGRLPNDAPQPDDALTGEDAAVPADGGPEGDEPTDD